LVLVAVVVVRFFALAHRNHATVGYFADRVFKLDGGVVDAEVVEQALFPVAQDALAD
jgi:3-phosphoglycerate kinase